MKRNWIGFLSFCLLACSGSDDTESSGERTNFRKEALIVAGVQDVSDQVRRYLLLDFDGRSFRFEYDRFGTAAAAAGSHDEREISPDTTDLAFGRGLFTAERWSIYEDDVDSLKYIGLDLVWVMKLHLPGGARFEDGFLSPKSARPEVLEAARYLDGLFDKYWESDAGADDDAGR